MLQDARLRSELEEMIRQRHYSPEYAVSRILRRYAQVFQRLESALPGGAGQRHLRHREAAAAAPAGPPPRRHRAPHLARARAGPQPHAQRDGQSRPPLRPRFRHRDRRARQPHGDRGRGPGNPRRRRHRTLPDRRLRRRTGDHRRRQGPGDPPARRGNARPAIATRPRKSASAAVRLEPLRDLPADNRRRRAASTCCGNIEFPYEVDHCVERGADGVGLYRTEFLYLGSETEPTEEVHFQAYSRVVAGDGRQAGDHPHVRPGRRQDAAPAAAGRRAQSVPGPAEHPPGAAAPCRCSARSCGPSCGPACWAISRSCSRWSRRCWNCARRRWCWPT